MKPPTKPVSKHSGLWIVLGLIVVIALAVAWAIHNRSNGDSVLSRLKATSIYADMPTSQSVLLAEGSDKGFSNVEVTQGPSIAKVYAVPGQELSTLIAHYRQTYPSYDWHDDNYYPSPGVTGIDLVGHLGKDDANIYIGSAPYMPQYPSLTLKQAATGHTAYVTVLLSEKK